jgi:hypothetical protein
VAERHPFAARLFGRKFYSYRSPYCAGVNLEPATELPRALPHPRDSDARQRPAVVQLLQRPLQYAAAVISDLKEEFTGPDEKTDFSTRAVRVAVDIRERFLRDSKQLVSTSAANPNLRRSLCLLVIIDCFWPRISKCFPDTATQIGTLSRFSAMMRLIGRPTHCHARLVLPWRQFRSGVRLSEDDFPSDRQGS